MTIKETKTEQNQTLANVPIVLWRRFKTKCVSKGMSMTQGFIEAVTDWLKKN